MAASPEVNPYTGRVRRVTWLRRAVAAVLLGVAGAVAGLYFIHRRQAPAAVTAPLLGLRVQQSASGVTIARDENGRPVFRVHAARVDKLRAGGSGGGSAGDEVLHDVQIEVFDREGRASDTITGDEFSYNESSFALQARGQVAMTLAGANPVHVTARDLSYNVRSGEGAIAEGLAFSYLNATGHADAAGLDGHAARLRLRGVALTWKRPGETDLNIRGGTAAIERRGDGADAAVIRLSDGASVSTGAQSLTADALVFHFRSDQTLRQVEADGRVAAQDTDPARALQARAGRAVAEFVPAGLHHTALQHLQLQQGAELRQNLPGRASTLTAQTMEFQLGRAHQLQTLLASGAARLEVGGPRRQSLAAPALVFDFVAAAAGAPRLAAVHSLGRADMQLVAGGNSSAPVTASADAMELTLDESQHPRHGLAEGHVEIGQTAQGDPRHSQADRLELIFAPGAAASTLAQAIETGHVVLRQGERVVRGDRLVYRTDRRSTEMTADAHSAYSHGFVRGEDALTRFQARYMTWTPKPEGGGQLAARGDVSLSREATPGTALPAGGLDTRLPLVVTARELDWTQPAAAAGHAAPMGSAVFRGGVRLLQSPNLLMTDQLQLDQRAGTLLAQGHVRTTFLAPPSSAPLLNPAPSATPSSPVAIQAESLQYEQAGGEAIFRGQVVMQSGNARLTAPELQVWLRQKAAGGIGRLERALAQGGVNLTQPGRTATAQQLRYDFAAGRIELAGGPPSILDAEHGQIHGDPLTFFLASDEIQVGSPRGARAEGQTVVH